MNLRRITLRRFLFAMADFFVGTGVLDGPKT